MAQLGDGVDDARVRHERTKRREIGIRDIAIGAIEHHTLPHGTGSVRQDADDLLIRAEQMREPLELHTGEHGHKDALRRCDGRRQRLRDAVDHLRLDAEEEIPGAFCRLRVRRCRAAAGRGEALRLFQRPAGDEHLLRPDASDRGARQRAAHISYADKSDHCLFLLNGSARFRE